MGKVQSDSHTEVQKTGDLKSIYIDLKNRFEEYKGQMAARVKDLEEKLDEVLEENEDMRGGL